MADPVTALSIGMKAVGWIASPIISELFKRSSSYLDFDASEKLLQLGPKVLLLERAMEVFQSPNMPHDQLKPLLENLKSAFYEAEDILDDVEYYCLEKKIRNDKSKSDGGARPTKDWVKKLKSALPSSPLKNKETGIPKKELKDSLEKIEDIIKNAYKFVEHLKLSGVSIVNESQAVATMSRGAATTSAPPRVVIGREKDCDKIIAMLHEKEGDGQPITNNGLCYSVIGIHGISGSGKSTLAQLVCAREKRDDHFDLVMWVHVSQSFSVGAIFKEIFEAATGGSCPQLDNLDTLQNVLEEKLHGKRFLLVLDDIWCNMSDERQKGNLEQILSPLKAGQARSKILVTSRSEDALSIMGAAKPRRIPISDLEDDDFHRLLMHYALDGAAIDDHVRGRLNAIGAEIAKKLKGSPLAARTVGGRLGRRPDAGFWTTFKDMKLVDETMGALWWSYQHLSPQARRCFAYCSIFPRRHHLHLDELVKLWVAEGFIRNTSEGEEMEDVCREHFDELVSTSFLQPGEEDEDDNEYYLIHDLLHDLAEKVAGSDCFRIENDLTWRGGDLIAEGWTGGIPNPRDVHHLFVQRYDGELITEKILQLKNLRTLIIYTVIEPDTTVEEKVIESIFKRLLKLRVLAVGSCVYYHNASDRHLHILPVPESIGQLKHLRYLAFYPHRSSRIILPSTLNKLYHIQLLDFGKFNEIEFTPADPINLGHVSFYRAANISNMGRLTSLHTLLPFFEVRNEQGYEVKQLRDLNKLRGELYIFGLENVKSKGEALEANLAAKERLTELLLCWNGLNSVTTTRCSPEVEAEVLEVLCPPMGLESLSIQCYRGSRYPNWMVDKQNGGPKYLEELDLYGWSQLGHAPGLEAFTHLRVLRLDYCSWDTLPNMEHLTSLKRLQIFKCLNIRSLPTLPQSLCALNVLLCSLEALPGNMEDLASLKRLEISGCKNIRSLPTLPQSLEKFKLIRCDDEFMKSCQTVEHPNWQKIKHIPKKKLEW